jgi:hypothetical protein
MLQEQHDECGTGGANEFTPRFSGVSYA